MSKTVHKERSSLQSYEPTWMLMTWWPYIIAEHTDSHAQNLHGASEVTRQTLATLDDNSNSDGANLFLNENFIQKLAYLVDTLETK